MVQPMTEELSPRERALLIREAIEECALCDEDGYLPNMTVCDHVDRTEINRRGMAKIRALGLRSNPDVLHRYRSNMPTGDLEPGELTGNRSLDDPEPEL